MEDLQKADASISRIRELFAIQSKIQDGPGAQLPKGPLRVDFKDVDYSAMMRICRRLMDLTMTLKPGEVLGLLGRTGSGKSTIARLLITVSMIPQSGVIALRGNGYSFM